MAEPPARAASRAEAAAVTAAGAGNPRDDRAARDAVTPSRVVDEQALRIGSRIRELRRRRGLTLVRLAERTDLSHPFLSQLERGHARPSMVSLERIATALGTTQVELLAAGPGLPDARTAPKVWRTP